MKYEIVFYRSGQTAGIQQLTEKILSDLDFTITNASAAGDPKELGSCVSSALKRNRLIIVAGCIDDSPQSTEKLVSGFLKPAGSKKESISMQLIKKDRDRAYYIKSGNQMILILPDSAESISALSEEIRKAAAMIFSIELKKQSEPDIKNIASSLDIKLADRSRIKVLPSGSNAEKSNERKLKKMKLIIIMLLILGALELGAAAALFFLNGGRIF